MALDRALALLNAIIADRGVTGLAGIGELLGIPQSSAYRLATALASRGLIVFSEPGHYLPGSSLFLVMGDHEAARTVAKISSRFVRRLAQLSGVVAHLGVLEGGMVTYLVKAGDNSATHLTREGMQLEAYCSAIGKVLLAHLPAEDLDTYLSTGPFVKLTERTLVDPAILREHMNAVARLGFAIDDREVATDLRCVAVPVKDSSGTVRAALSISASPLRLNDQSLGRDKTRLQTVADAIQLHLAGGAQMK